MKTKLNTSKFKILLTLVITLVVTSVSWITNPIPARADDVSVLVEGYSADSDITSSDGYWYSTYCKGAGYKGQGILIYLIERNGGGAVPGTQPKAFACSTVMGTYELHAQDKFNKYPEVTTWQRTPSGQLMAPHWAGVAGKQQGGGLIKSSTSSNLNDIKAWLSTTTESGSSTKGIWLVQTLWGQSIAEEFTKERYILVVEPIVSTQFSQTQKTNLKTKIAAATTLDDIKSAITDFWYITDAYKNNTGVSQSMQKLLSDSYQTCVTNISIPSQYQSVIVNGIKQDIATKISSDTLYTTNYPAEIYCGTPKRILDFYASYTPQISFGMTWTKAQSGVQYYRRAAHQSAFIKDTTVVCKDAIPLPNRWPSNKDIRRLHTDNDIRTKSIGMFAMLAWHQDITGGSDQTTCDEPKQPLPHPAPNESTGTCTIIKSYRTKTATGNLIDPSTHTKDNTSATISIEEEEEYKVIGWKISDTRNPSIDARYWETTVPGNINSAGTTPADVMLPDTHRVLYVLLEKPLGQVDGNYELSQSSITRHININSPDSWSVGSGSNKIEINVLSSHSFEWTVPAHTKTDCGGHAYNYRSCGSIHSYNCGQTRYCTNNGVVVPCGDTNGDGKVTSADNNCGGHTCGGDSKHPQCSKLCDNNTCIHDTDYCTWGKWSDDTLNFGLTSTKAGDYPNILATKSGTYLVSDGAALTAWSASDKRTNMSSLTLPHGSANYHALIHRGQTQIVIADWKNNDGTKNFLKDLTSNCFTVSSSIPASRPGRKNADYTSTFEVGISGTNDSTTRVPSAEAPNSKAKCGGETVTSSFTDTTKYTTQAKVAVKVYLGRHDSTTKDTTVPGANTYSSSGTHYYGVATRCGGITNFRPYVRMKYDTLGSDIFNPIPAYVLGEHDRNLEFNSYADISWTESNTPNITLNSLQWSIHQSAKKTHVQDTVLPGGATLTLTIKSTDRQTITVRTYQPILVGAGKTQLDKAGGSTNLPTLDDTKNAHKAYVDSVVDSIGRLHLQQYADDKDYGSDKNVDRSKSKDVFNNGGKVGNGVEFKPTPSVTLGGSSDTKYYFDVDTSGINGESKEGDLDCKVENTTGTYYTFWCDPSGSIRVAYGNNISIANTPLDDPYAGGDDAVVCRRDIGSETCSWVTTSSKYKIALDINNKTGVVTKLIKGLEKGGGMDYSANWVYDGMWYNEAFDGITYYLQTSKITVGFMTPTERVTVIDPKLCPPNSGKSDLFTKYYSTQIRLEDSIRDTSGNLTNNEKIGKFKDPVTGTTVDIKLPNLGNMFWSREFYIPNVNTQDLN